MKVLLDQNIDHRLAGYLRKSGHDVTAIAYDYPHGLSDQGVLAIAVREQRLLNNNDRADFSELIFRYDHPHCGVILLRLLTLQDVPLKTRNNDCSTSSRTFKNTSTISWSSRRKRYAYVRLRNKQLHSACLFLVRNELLCVPPLPTFILDMEYNFLSNIEHN